MAKVKAHRRANAAVKAHDRHPGFKAVAASIARSESLPIDRARAILASRTRGASAKAKKANPFLARVKG